MHVHLSLLDSKVYHDDNISTLEKLMHGESNVDQICEGSGEKEEEKRKVQDTLSYKPNLKELMDKDHYLQTPMLYPNFYTLLRFLQELKLLTLIMVKSK